MGGGFRMIELKMRDVLECGPIIKKLGQIEFPADVAYELVIIMRALDEKQKVYVDKQNMLLRKYGERDEKGELVQKEGKIIIKKEDEQLFTEETLTVLDAIAQFPVDPIPIEKLKNLKITPMELLPLFPFLKK